MGIETVCVTDSRQEFKLAQAILLYEGNGARGSGIAYASAHPVTERKKGGGFEIAAGVPVSKAGIAAALRALAPEQTARGQLIPNHILAQGDDHLVWWRPPAMRQVWFNCKEIGARTNKVPNPGFVFLVTRKAWMIFAVKGRKRPEPGTKLFQAPYFNVWADGKICVGSAQTPKGDAVFMTEVWEDAFFRSYFTHPNVHTPKGLTLYENGPYALWRDLLDGNLAKFPENTLVPARRTLQQAFDAAIAEMEE